MILKNEKMNKKPAKGLLTRPKNVKKTSTLTWPPCHVSATPECFVQYQWRKAKANATCKKKTVTTTLTEEPLLGLLST